MVKTIAIVSLSAGTIGEDFVAHDIALGLKRLEEYGIQVKMMPHTVVDADAQVISFAK